MNLLLFLYWCLFIFVLLRSTSTVIFVLNVFMFLHLRTVDFAQIDGLSKTLYSVWMVGFLSSCSTPDFGHFLRIFWIQASVCYTISIFFLISRSKQAVWHGGTCLLQSQHYGELKQNSLEFKANLGYLVISCFKNSCKIIHGVCRLRIVFCYLWWYPTLFTHRDHWGPNWKRDVLSVI